MTVSTVRRDCPDVETATVSAACRAKQRRGCVSRTSAAREEGFWQTRGRARPVWSGARRVGGPGIDAGVRRRHGVGEIGRRLRIEIVAKP